jgi:hypothetical protein
MTHFDTLYSKLLSDPNYGKIGSRKEQFRQMYLEGMKRIKEIAVRNSEKYIPLSMVEKEIAEESK